MQDYKFNSQPTLSASHTFPSYVTHYSLANATSRGIVFEVTQSVSKDAFEGGLVRIFLTARLLRALGSSCFKSDVIVDREHCVAHAASKAWQRANELGREATSFFCNTLEDEQMRSGVQLRLERMRTKSCTVFTIGYPEDFLSLE